jgi:hypothetical protein
MRQAAQGYNAYVGIEIQFKRERERRFESNECPTTPKGNEEAESAPNGREQKAFGQELSDESRATSSQGKADRHLPLACSSSCQQQVGEISTHNQEH